MKEMKKTKAQAGITLIALVVTIIILLILAGVAINVALGENGLFNKSKEALEKHKIEAVREKIEMTLSEAQLDKETNPGYEEGDYLTELIKNSLPDANVLEDVIELDGYAFELDRSVPRLGNYIGHAGKIVSPIVDEPEVTISADKSKATISISAVEEESGIEKIEIIKDGTVIGTIDCERSKEKITKTYDLEQNGTYIIKVYGNIAVTKTVKVNGIFMPVTFSPNGSSEWQKTYSVKLSVEDTSDPVSSIKYKWLEDVTGVTESNFTDAESCNNGDTVEFATDSNGEPTNKLNGTYYLWTMMETTSGQKEIKRSEAFYFDNAGPIIDASSEATSVNSFKIVIEASDDSSGVLGNYKILDENQNTVKEGKATGARIEETVDVEEAGIYNYKIVVEDCLHNESNTNLECQTKKYSWNIYTIATVNKWELVSTAEAGSTSWNTSSRFYCGSEFTFSETGGPRLRWRDK